MGDEDAGGGSGGSRLDTVATALAGSFATVSAVLGVLGVTGGGLDKMLRNHPVESTITFGLVALAVGLAAVSRSALMGEALQRTLLITGTLMFAAGLVGATVLAVMTPSDAERPSIAATIDPVTKDLNVNVKAGGLASSDRIQIVVNGLYPKALTAAQEAEAEGEDAKPTISRESAALYESTLGPNSAGTIDVSLSIPVPSGTFDKLTIAAHSLESAGQSLALDDDDCRQSDDEGQGCLVLSLAPSSVRPRVEATWESSDGKNVFSLEVQAHDVDYNAGISLSVVGFRRDGEIRNLYSTLVAPDSEGLVETTVKVPVGARLRSICAAAVVASPTNPSQDYRTLVTEGPKCPPDVKPLTAWTQSHVPGSKVDAGSGDAAAAE